MMSQVNIAWVAGIIEGEGSIQKRAHANGASVCVQMTDEDVIRRLHEVTGMGSVSGPYKASHSRLDGQPRKARWFWQVGRRAEVARLLLAIAPLLGQRRKAQIEVVIPRLSAADRNVKVRPNRRVTKNSEGPGASSINGG